MFVWFESEFITADEARAKVSPLAPRSVFGPPPAPSEEALANFSQSSRLLDFHGRVLDVFPPLEALPEDDPRSVWTFTPRASDRVVELRVSLAGSHAEPTIRALAAEFGLVCYEPQTGAVWPNVPSYQPAILLDYGYLSVPDPEPARVQRVVLHLSHKFAEYDTVTLRSVGRTSLEIRYRGSDADRPSTFVLRLGDGDNWTLWSETADPDQVVSVVRSFHDQSDDWRRLLDWSGNDQ